MWHINAYKLSMFTHRRPQSVHVAHQCLDVMSVLDQSLYDKCVQRLRMWRIRFAMHTQPVPISSTVTHAGRYCRVRNQHRHCGAYFTTHCDINLEATARFTALPA